jgi:hypothetical protein
VKRPNTRTRRSRKWHGGKWIRPQKRLAIHDRDGWVCVYCGWSPDELSPVPLPGRYANHLTIDHVKPVDAGGTNDATNLITACHRCNSSRQNKTPRRWYAMLRGRGVDTRLVQARIRRLTKKPLDTARGQELFYLRKEAQMRGSAPRAPRVPPHPRYPSGCL